ncbi:MFS transporter [Streptomyces sp. NBC_01264]|uniref:MFS transporter n=1 Tax=Streptomyces sp. NBC_01264 TaxID=2903804 RepID=UPI00225193DE|nr:MFS transporter [Streptomyces sp. NBC_01264]MCX4781970.1 MFS transporter [Streptomyces sp. NBC_01264]
MANTPNTSDTPDTPNPSNPAAAHPGSVLARLGIPRSISWGYLGLLVFMSGVGIEAGYLSPYLESLGIAASSVAMVFTVYGITGAVAAWFAGALSDLWGPRKVMWLGLATFAVTHVFFLAVAVPSRSYPLLLLAYALRGLAFPLFAYSFLVWIAAVAPARQMGSAMGWFWSAFSAGLPTLGSLGASLLIPHIGEYGTLWVALGVVGAGGLVSLLLVKEPTGSARLAPAGESPMAGLVGSLTILYRNPKVGAGAAVRMFNTASQFGFMVMLPVWFVNTIGLTNEQWLRLVAVMFGTNIFTNLMFGVIGDKIGWRTTVAWCGGLGCTISTLVLYYVPTAVGSQYLLCLLVAVFYGATLSGYVPLSALMTAIAPSHKGQAMAALNLGAGASAFLGPLTVSLFLGPIGVGGVTWIFAGYHAVSALLTLLLKTAPGPGEPTAPGTAFETRSTTGDAELLAAPAPKGP